MLRKKFICQYFLSKFPVNISCQFLDAKVTLIFPIRDVNNITVSQRNFKKMVCVSN